MKIINLLYTVDTDEKYQDFFRDETLVSSEETIFIFHIMVVMTTSV